MKKRKKKARGGDEHDKPKLFSITLTSINYASFSKLIVLLSNFSILIAGYQKPAKFNGLF